MGASAEMREASSAARVRAAVRLALEANSRSRSCTRAMHRSTVTVTTCGHTVSIRANLRRSIHVSFWVRHVRENRESRPDRDFFSLGRAGRVESPNPGMRVHPSPSSPGNYPLSRVGVGMRCVWDSTVATVMRNPRKIAWRRRRDRPRGTVI